MLVLPSSQLKRHKVPLCRLRRRLNQPHLSLPRPRHRPVIAASANECDVSIERAAHFVWDIPADDPDGGLVAHTGAGVDKPVTRIIRAHQVVLPTGGCARSDNGSAWYELESPSGTLDWVNARNLQQAEVACLSGGPALPTFHVLWQATR